MSEISLISEEYVMQYNRDTTCIEIGNCMKYIEFLVEIGLIHETLHLVLHELEGGVVSCQFDNLFGMLDRSVIFIPNGDWNDYLDVMVPRIEKWWREETKQRGIKR